MAEVCEAEAVAAATVETEAESAEPSPSGIGSSDGGRGSHTMKRLALQLLLTKSRTFSCCAVYTMENGTQWLSRIFGISKENMRNKLYIALELTSDSIDKRYS